MTSENTDVYVDDIDSVECKYRLGRVLQLSNKPILSVGTYESLDAECIIAGSSDRNVRFLEINTLDEIARCKVTKKNVSFVAVSEMSPEGDEPIIATGGKDSVVQIWDPIEGTLAQSILLPTQEVRSLAVYNGTSAYLVVGTKDAKVIVWDIKKDSLVCVFSGHKASVHCVSITTYATDLETQYDMDFLCIASGGADRTVRTWDIATGKRKKKFRHKRSISTMLVANKNVRPILATAGVERLIKLWDVESGVLLRTLEGHLDQINCLCLWEGYEMLIISGSNDQTLRVYDVLSGECLCVLQGHTEAVLGVTIANKDDPVLVSSSDDLSLIQWSLTDIICDFFHTEDELLGSRNSVKPDLPVLTYRAPPEIDRSVVPKEERKRLRKEAKRLKRMKANDAMMRTVTAARRRANGHSEEGLGGVTPDDAGDGERLDDGEDDDERDYDKGRDREGSDDDGSDEDCGERDFEEKKKAEENSLRNHDIPIISEKVDVPVYEENEPTLEEEEILPLKEDGSFSSPVPTAATTAEESEQNPTHYDTNLARSFSAQKVAPFDQSAAVSSSDSGSLIVVKSLIGRVLSMSLGIGGSEKVGIDPEVSPLNLTNQPSTVLMNAGSRADISKKSFSIQNAEDHEYKDTFEGQAKIPIDREDEEDENADIDEEPVTSGSSIGKISLRKGKKKQKMKEQNDQQLFRKHADNATTKYNEAIAANQLETDLQKTKASEKLAIRLNMKKNRGLSGNAPPAGEGDDEESKLHALKAEKLRQHKLLESRRKHNMAMAQDRAKGQLQKRLEELAAKKKADSEAGIKDKDDEGDDEDEGNESEDSS